jgi:hypothetical protein
MVIWQKLNFSDETFVLPIFVLSLIFFLTIVILVMQIIVTKLVFKVPLLTTRKDNSQIPNLRFSQL